MNHLQDVRRRVDSVHHVRSEIPTYKLIRRSTPNYRLLLPMLWLSDWRHHLTWVHRQVQAEVLQGQRPDPVQLTGPGADDHLDEVGQVSCVFLDEREDRVAVVGLVQERFVQGVDDDV